MKTFKKWDKKYIEDWGSQMSDDAKSFYRAFKNYLKRSLPEAEIIGFKPNHYDASGFIKINNRYIYISHCIDRYKKRVDFNETGAANGVLIRTAINDHDYTGGNNNFTSIYNLVEDLKKLSKKMEAQG